MRSFIRKYEVWVALGLILLANAAFVNSVVQGILPVGLYRFGRFALLATVLFGIVFLCRGFEGVKSVIRPMFAWKRSPLFYVFAIFWTLGLCLVVLTSKGIITGDFFSLREVAEGMRKVSNPQLLLTLLVSSVVGEIVWVSYAVRKLSEQFT
ncbi:MAG: hypothetical protein P1V20_16520, partial [Verrucomicrobiales bacterium]|nr:hypothetical protein [Verrucomicrobiales bacterium]